MKHCLFIDGPIVEELQSIALAANFHGLVDHEAALDYIVTSMCVILDGGETHARVAAAILDEGVLDHQSTVGEAQTNYLAYHHQLMAISILIEKAILDSFPKARHERYEYSTEKLFSSGRLAISIEDNEHRHGDQTGAPTVHEHPCRCFSR